ncbi:nitrite/sulfite reductase [Heliophilum fasciatum]|uniref:Sulfite reductase beta subunit-like hemoprotein n=1 Tax=Heliophilum fasciatum TaxID=35700 RepID=A0A4R2RWC4_9FIRM|nr:nitrite/sulfite reductase [Heliophilum fasciatum]MCW2276789.1 sulfite reductase (NADPH) hemoprotein beta-component [Heliophilum fasciatum]TCP68750.1 sulfite reductase beta subunit-like hemoprotein [Heliophilum fasciatum]
MELSPEAMSAHRLQGIDQQREKDRFFVRFRLPLGRWTAEQLAGLADVVAKTEQGKLEVLSRQSVQMQGLTRAETEAMREKLTALGLSPVNSSSKSMHNVVALYETGHFVQEVAALATFLDQAISPDVALVILEHKFAIPMSDAVPDAMPGAVLYHDIGLLPVARPEGLRWQVYVGGGLGRQPQRAELLPVEVPTAQVRSIVQAILDLFLAVGAGKRMKALVHSLGVADFWAQVQERWTPIDELLPAVEPLPEGDVVITDLPDAVLTAVQLRALAMAARRFTGGVVYLGTERQIYWRGILPEEKDHLLAELAAVGLGQRGIIAWAACPGRASCRRGLIDTALRGAIEAELQQKPHLLAAFDRLRIHISGCPSSCTRTQVADIGLNGAVMKGKPGQPAVTITVGGGLDGAYPVLGTRWGVVEREAVPAAIVTILEEWLAQREGEETFRQTHLRLSATS